MRSLIEEMRTRLLDLSGNNRLLNFRASPTNCLRVVDELPNQLFEALINGGSFTLAPVPQPGESEVALWHERREGVPRAAASRGELPLPKPEEWAQHLGIDTSYELPIDQGDERHQRHADGRIQTLLYPGQLETRLRKLRRDAATAIEETGTNLLHIAFGFLDWREGAANSRGSLAPLILVPVEISEKRTPGGQRVFDLSWSGEDFQTNLSLQKKLRDDFALDLPDLPDLVEFQGLTDGATPESYIRSVRELVRPREDWLVRRFATLSLFQFGKLLMYRDLDPRSWPDGTEPAAHGIVSAIVAGRNGGENGGENGGLSFESPEKPSARTIDLDLDLVERADESQASAIHAALAGSSLVVEGPPGTGKSQTITNLIAGALAAGKTVLFVSEKLAALKVVRDRLDDLGLGDFVLELHSNKTRKTALLDDLRGRLERSSSFRAARDFGTASADLAHERDRADDVHSALGETVGVLGIKVSKTLFEAGRHRRSLKDLRQLGIVASTSDVLALDKNAIDGAKAVLADFAEAAGLSFAAGRTLADHPFAGVSSEAVLGTPDREEILSLLGTWQEALDDLSAALTELGGSLGVPSAASRKEACGWSELDGLRGSVESLLAATESIGDLPGRVAAMFDLTDETALERTVLAASILDLAARRPKDLRPFGAALLSDRSDEAGRLELVAAFDALAEARAGLAAQLDLGAAARHADARLDEMATILSRGGVLRWLRADFRAARRETAALAGASLSTEETARRLRATADHLRAEKRLLADDDLLRFVGGRQVSTPDLALRTLSDLGDARRHAEAIEAVFGRGLGPRATLSRRLLNVDASDAADLAAAATTEEGQALRAIGARLGGQIAPTGAQGPPNLREAILATFGIKSEAARSIARMDATARTILFDRLASVRDLSDAERDAGRRFTERTELDARFWNAGDDDLGRLRDRVRTALAEASGLTEWIEIDRRHRRVELPLAKDILQAALDRRIALTDMGRYLDFAVFDTLAREAFAHSPVLKSLGRSEIDAIRRRYGQLDERTMELRAIEIAAKVAKRSVPQGRSGARTSDLTQMRLIERELAKKTRYVPIRQLVGRAGKALQALKPCFMMGPLSVAQYLQPGALTFDLVVFDEASQVRPEEAIGALARGGQAVIVGDSKQLPPTDFFQRTIDGGDDGAIAASAESILEIAELQLPKRSLAWHYRSQHPDLIAFSNHEFYDGNLVLFPSPNRTSDDLGVRFQHVPDAFFRDGTNRVEAEAVVEAVFDHLERYPADSLGVVAMNLKQRDLILETLDRRRAERRVAAGSSSEFDDLQDRFFVKNLENVQGDERDGIIISMTYGPSVPGERVSQAFGPISGDNGWRRLNVLFSRAKKRMHVVSSMREGDIMPGDAAKRGPRALKSFLRFAETGRLERIPRPGDQGDRLPDSDFELAVIEGLEAAGHACVPQVGSSGFFIDIGVVDPDAPERFLVGIECDGASYHSSLSARDRDRLRQEILEAKGWRIERVWSTDWFRDPDHELARLLGRIEAIREEARRPARPEADLTLPPGPIPDSAADRLAASPSAAPSFELEAEAASNRSQLVRKPEKDRTDLFEESGAHLSRDQARRLLIGLRERIAAANPAYDRETSVLRKSMLTELLAKRPSNEKEFRILVRPDLRSATKGSELRDHGSEIFDILERTL